MHNCTRAAVAVAGLLLACAALAKESEYSKGQRLAAPDLGREFRDEVEAGGFADLLRIAAVAVHGDDLEAKDRSLGAVIAHRLFRDLEPGARQDILSTAASVAVDLGQYSRARDLTERAIAADPADPDDWYRLSLLESDLGETGAAALHLARLARDWPQLLDNLYSPYIFRLVRELDPDSAPRLELMQALFDAGWTRRGLGADSLWYELALARLRRADIAAARSAVARIDEPMTLVRMRADRRFDAVLDHSGPASDVARAAHAQLARLRALAAEAPERLSTWMELSYALLRLGRHDEVIALADEVAAAIAAAAADAAPLQDMHDEVWILNNRAIALRRLGRIDEALADLARASRMAEEGETNVSQTLNLGQFLIGLERPRQALAAVAAAGNMSGYGRMVQASVQLRGALQLGDDVAAARALDHLREHREDSQWHLLYGLLAMERMDEAAATLLELLASEDERAEVLFWAQDFLETVPLPGTLAKRAARDALLAREEVRVAIERVGRRERHAIYGHPGTD